MRHNDKYGFERVFGLGQLKINRDGFGRIKTIATKITKDILIARKLPDLHKFMVEIIKKFKVSKAVIDDQITFNGCKITEDI